MPKFATTGYLVVKISDLVDERYIGCKCIPVCWAENSPGNNNYLIIRYPEEESAETKLQIQNKEPPKTTWPFYSALIMFRTESYEKALQFIAENEKKLLITADEQPTNKINKAESYEKTRELIAEINKQNFTAAVVPENTMKIAESSETPSTSSLKRRNSSDKNIIIEDYQPKKKRESAIRSENNLKMLIQSGQVDTNKQKVSPKKVLSFRKEVQTETLASLIKAQKFDQIAKLISKTTAAGSHGSKDNVETSDSESETFTPPVKKRVELVTSNVPNPTSTTVTNVANLTNTITVLNPISSTVTNDTYVTNTVNAPNTTNEPNTTNITIVPNSTTTINVQNSTNMPKSTDSTIEPKPSHSTIEPKTSNSTLEPKPSNPTIEPKPSNSTIESETNKSANIPNSTNTTHLPKLTNTTFEPNPTIVPNPTNNTNMSNSENTIIMAIPTSTTNDRINTLNKINSLQSYNYSTRLKTRLCEAVDTSITQISSTNNLDENKETETDSNASQSSLEAEVLALHKLISTLASDNSEKGTESHSTVDIKYIEDMYDKVLAVKSKLDGVYQEKSLKLRKSFENIHLIVPELKRGLILPTLQEFKEKNQLNPLSPRQEQPSHSKGPLSHTSKSPQRSSSSESEDSPPQPSNPFPKCSYVAKWTLRYKGPGPGLTEVMENTGIYIDEAEFRRSKLLATDMRHLARLLLPLIFSEEAMSKCSYTGNGPNGKRPKSDDDMHPGLDEHARNVLMTFVNQHAKECRWAIVSPKLILHSLGDKLRKFRLRHRTWKRVNDAW